MSNAYRACPGRASEKSPAMHLSRGMTPVVRRQLQVPDINGSVQQLRDLPEIPDPYRRISESVSRMRIRKTARGSTASCGSPSFSSAGMAGAHVSLKETIFGPLKGPDQQIHGPGHQPAQEQAPQQNQNRVLRRIQDGLEERSGVSEENA